MPPQGGPKSMWLTRRAGGSRAEAGESVPWETVQAEMRAERAAR
jgi:hypothetical protein